MRNKKAQKTRIYEMVEIEYHIFLQDMGWTAGPKFTADVSNNGGFSVLGTKNMTLEQPTEKEDSYGAT